MTKNADGTVTWRIGELERKVDLLDTKMDKVLEEHLPTIEKDILSVKTRVNVVTAVNIAAIIMGIIVGRIIQ